MALPDPLQHNTALLEKALRALFSSHSFPLYHLMEYQLGWRDERAAPLELPVQQVRLHGNLCLMACQAVGGVPERALPSAAAVELIFQFTQLHGDIQEGNQGRYGRPTVWWVWGPAQAINAGDGLHALGRLAMIQLGEGVLDPSGILQLLQVLDAASLRMCEGLHQDLVYQERVDISPEAYINMVREKTGALLGCALQLGAMAGGCSAADAHVFRQFGEEVGVALQIQEDIQTLWGEPLYGRPKGADILNKKKVFPVVHALEHAPLNRKRELGTLFFKRVLEPPDLEHVVAILDSLDTRASAQRLALQYYDQAITHLQGVKITAQGRDDLIGAACWLAIRDKTS